MKNEESVAKVPVFAVTHFIKLGGTASIHAFATLRSSFRE